MTYEEYKRQQAERKDAKLRTLTKQYNKNTITGRYKAETATVSARTVKNVEKGREKTYKGLFSKDWQLKHSIKPTTEPYFPPFTDPNEEEAEVEEEPMREHSYHSTGLSKDDPNTYFKQKKRKENMDNLRGILDQISTNHGELTGLRVEDKQWEELDDVMEDIDIYDDIDDEEDWL